MNLVDLLDEGGLQQDEWSLTAPTFGEDSQLTVVGWSGKRKGKSDKFYILKCNKCSQDNELFGEGCFRSTKDNLVKGKVPCGCSKNPKWPKEQYFILCSRKAKELGYTFLGFVGEWKGKDSKIKMSCGKHGDWSSGSINNTLSHGHTCPKCKAETLSKPDDVMIASFFASGAFHPDTKFWRSERKNSRGAKAYWYISCPECDETGESRSGNLQLGQRPCACSNQRQKEAYINWLIDDHMNYAAIKFGIANNSLQRAKQQNSTAAYEIQQYEVYIFPSVEMCRKAERECKKELDCGVVLKRDMPDGWSETTHTYNLGKIKQIYINNSGVKL